MVKIIGAWSVLLTIVLLTGYSCKDKVVEPDFLKIETSNGNKVNDVLSVGTKGLTQSFVVKSNSSWRVVTSGDNTSWLSVHPDYGKGDGTFSLVIESNTTLYKREAQLSCTVNGRELAVLKIEQEGLGPDLTVTPVSSNKLPYKGGEIEFVIKADADWDYTISNGSWLSEKTRTSTSLILEASENTIESERLGTIVFAMPSVAGLTQEVKVSQEGVSRGPVADLLDLLFKADGTAEDLSPAKHNISTLAGLTMSTVYSNTFQRYMARFNHAPGGTSFASGFYKMDYSSNQMFKNALSDGHTMESMFMLDFDSPLPDAEIKMFSSHQSGGTGLMIGNKSRNNSIIFLPHVGSGYAWANSNIIPERGKYYHVVGVWNKQEGKAYVYVNGELKGSVNTSGNFNFPSVGSNWFGVGADPAGATTAHTGWKGDVVIARIYDKPLGGADIEKLWEQVKDFKPSPTDIQLSKISLPSKRVQIDAEYTIKAEGFMAGDKIKMVPVSGGGAQYLSDATVAGNSLTFKIPANFVTGRYRFFVVRGSKEADIGFATLTVADKAVGMPEIIAHRGYWKTGASQNSLAALIRAQELDIYGSEFDVWITTDGEVVLNHDPTINNIRIESVPYSQLKDITLGNGEKIPTLRQYLAQGKKDPSTKLILEIKTHNSSIGGVTNNDRVSAAVVNLVKEANMVDQVEYIAFSLDVCKKLLELQPNAIVAYLGGNRTPQELHNLGIKGIDYNISVIRQNKDWIAQAHNLGMTVNVWTVNSQSDLQEVIDDGVDFITTDEPVLAKRLMEED